MASAPVPSAVRVRFCPSPTGNPHVGLVRTALFNWAFARHHQGTLVFRIEDTDAARDSEESYEQLLDSMRWLGFDWDEGPEVGGPHAPYRQSQRMDLYKDVARKLLEAGHMRKLHSLVWADVRTEHPQLPKQLRLEVAHAWGLVHRLVDNRKAGWVKHWRTVAAAHSETDSHTQQSRHEPPTDDEESPWTPTVR
ncbi:hypothetical protein HCJ99_23845 [Streptomyces sp. C1-2]|nr:hypothetical protein [Streptomyces sp. C1-2]